MKTSGLSQIRSTGRVAFLLGAGASAGAGLPLAAGISDAYLKPGSAGAADLKEIFSDSDKQCVDLISQIYLNAESNERGFEAIVNDFDAVIQLGRKGILPLQFEMFHSWLRDPLAADLAVNLKRWLIGRCIFDPTIKSRSYMVPFVQKCIELDSPVISLNYDTCVEMTAEELGYSVNLGNVKSVVRRNKSLRMIKPHGSKDWASVGNGFAAERGGVIPLLPDKALIGGNKVTTVEPFWGQLKDFERCLDGLSVLVVVGFSYADEHINDFVIRWFRRTHGANLIHVSPDGMPEELLKRLTIYSEAPGCVQQCLRKAEDFFGS
jgi:SIR2-like domain